MRHHITRVIWYHPWVILSPVCYLPTRVISYYPCDILSSARYLITCVLSYHPCDVLSPVCCLIACLLSYHPGVIYYPCYTVYKGGCYIITRVIRYKVQSMLSGQHRREGPSHNKYGRNGKTHIFMHTYKYTLVVKLLYCWQKTTAFVVEQHVHTDRYTNITTLCSEI